VFQNWLECRKSSYDLNFALTIFMLSSVVQPLKLV